MLSSLREKFTMKIRCELTKNKCLYIFFIYITLQTYQTLCYIVRKSLCFEEHHMLLEMLHQSRKMYDYYYTY